MPEADGEELEYEYEDDHNAHVYAWRHAVDEDFQRYLQRRRGHSYKEYRRSPKQWATDQLFEHRRRNERLDESITIHEKRFFERVSAGKPYADYFALLSLHTILAGLFLSLGEQLMKEWSHRTAIATLFAAVYFVAMFRAFAHANDAFVDLAVLKVFRLMNFPNPPDVDWRSFRIVWAVTFVLLNWGLIIGSGLVGYDVTRRVVEQVIAKPPVHNQVSPP
jgi:hypothetical protein